MMPEPEDNTSLQGGPRTPRVPDRSSVRAVAAISVAAVALALLWWTQGRATPEVEAVAGSAPAAGAVVGPGGGLLSESGRPGSDPSTRQVPGPSASPSGPTPSGTPDAVVVDVRGAVRHPGLRRLPVGSRVSDAVQAAGGLRAGRGFGSVNLARVLTDGEQIIVGRPMGDATSATPSQDPSGAPPGADAPIDLNHASAKELEGIPGVGPVLAQRILEWRTANGPFRSVEDLLDVPGIGEAKLASMRNKITVS